MVLVPLRVGSLRAHRPAHVEFATSSGLKLPTFFDGVRPNAILKKQLKRRTPQHTCAQKEGAIDRIAAVLGISLTVHAQSYCEAQGCGATGVCYTQLFSFTCPGNCPARTYNYYAFSSDENAGFVQLRSKSHAHLFRI